MKEMRRCDCRAIHPWEPSRLLKANGGRSLQWIFITIMVKYENDRQSDCKVFDKQDSKAELSGALRREGCALTCFRKPSQACTDGEHNSPVAFRVEKWAQLWVSVTLILFNSLHSCSVIPLRVLSCPLASTEWLLIAFSYTVKTPTLFLFVALRSKWNNKISGEQQNEGFYSPLKKNF